MYRILDIRFIDMRRDFSLSVGTIVLIVADIFIVIVPGVKGPSKDLCGGHFLFDMLLHHQLTGCNHSALCTLGRGETELGQGWVWGWVRVGLGWVEVG